MNAINETTRKLVNLEVTDDGRLKTTGSGGGGGGAVDSVNGQTGVVVLDAADVGAATTAYVDAGDGTNAAAIALKAPLASPTLTGTPAAPTAAPGTNTTQIATTAFVAAAVVAAGGGDALTSDGLDQFASTTSAELAGVISDETGSGALVFGTAPTLSNPVVGTQSPGDNSTKAASTAYVDAADALKAPLASPTFTGTPAAPTASPGTNTTQLATTAYADAISALKLNLTGGTLTGALITPLSGTGGAMFRLPHGAAPSSPTNGDVWTTTAGLYARINGATVGPYIATAGGLTNFAESANTASPNATVNYSQLLAVGGTTHVDLSLRPKGSGALTRNQADGTVTGGNKRGLGAVDWQYTTSGSAAAVASGAGAVISGGEGNTANGATSVIGGGTNNTTGGGTSTVGGGNANNASGSWATIAGGNSNISSNSYTTVAGGQSNTASTASHATVGGGNLNTASGLAATVPGGQRNTASGDYSEAIGNAASTKGLQGARAWQVEGNNWGVGATQWMGQMVSIRTTDATATVLNAAGSGSAAAATSLVLDNNSARGGVIRLLAFKTSGTVAALYEWRDVLVTRGANAAATAFIGTPTLSTLQIHATATSESWAPVLQINTTLGSVEVKVVGGASSSVRWVATFDGLMLV